MMTLYDFDPLKFTQTAQFWYPEPKSKCGFWDPLINFICRAHVQIVGQLKAYGCYRMTSQLLFRKGGYIVIVVVV